MYTFLLTPYVLHDQRNSLFLIWSPEKIWWYIQITKHSLFCFLHCPVTLSLLDPNILLSTLFTNTSAYVPPSMWETKCHIKQNKNKLIILYFLIFIFLEKNFGKQKILHVMIVSFYWHQSAIIIFQNLNISALSNEILSNFIFFSLFTKGEYFFSPCYLCGQIYAK
jgi:hypothetical protein